MQSCLGAAALAFDIVGYGRQQGISKRAWLRYGFWAKTGNIQEHW
jgi:hypothetical protein